MRSQDLQYQKIRESLLQKGAIESGNSNENSPSEKRVNLSNSNPTSRNQVEGDQEWDESHARVTEISDMATPLGPELLREKLTKVKWRGMLSDPEPGSLLHFVRSHKTNSKDLDVFFSSVYSRNLLSVAGDENISLPAWFLFSLPLSHVNAVDLSEEVSKASKELVTSGFDVRQKDPEFHILTLLLGKDMTHRGDLWNEVRAVLRRYPKIFDYIMNKKKK